MTQEDDNGTSVRMDEQTFESRTATVENDRLQCRIRELTDENTVLRVELSRTKRDADHLRTEMENLRASVRKDNRNATEECNTAGKDRRFNGVTKTADLGNRDCSDTDLIGTIDSLMESAVRMMSDLNRIRRAVVSNRGPMTNGTDLKSTNGGE